MYFRHLVCRSLVVKIRVQTKSRMSIMGPTQALTNYFGTPPSLVL